MQVLANNTLIFTAVFRPVALECNGVVETKSVLAAERDMIASLPVAAVMIDEKGIIQAFNEVQYFLYCSMVINSNIKVFAITGSRAAVGLQT